MSASHPEARLGWADPDRARGAADRLLAKLATLPVVDERLVDGWRGDHNSLVAALQGRYLPRRERQVLQAAARGLTAAETAAELGVGYETVRSYRRRAMVFTGARSVTQAVAVAAQAGLI